EVAEMRHPGKLRVALGRAVVVDVAERDQILPLEALDRVVAPAADAAAGYVEPVVRRLPFGALRAQDVWQRGRRCGKRGGLKEGAAVHARGVHFVTWVEMRPGWFRAGSERGFEGFSRAMHRRRVRRPCPMCAKIKGRPRKTFV